MTCTELQDLLYSIKIDELNPSEENRSETPCRLPGMCRRISENIKADRVLSRLKDAPPRVQNEQALTESIISAIVSGRILFQKFTRKPFLIASLIYS